MKRSTLYVALATLALAAVSAQAEPKEPRDWRPIPRGKTYSQVAQECRSWAASDKAYADCINVQWPLLHAPREQRESAQQRLDEEYRRKPVR